MVDKKFCLLCAHFFTIAALLIFICSVFPSSTVFYFYSGIAYFILYINIVYITFGITKWCFLAERILPEGKAVLITGCDTGLGNELARRLDTLGFLVFASCLFPDAQGAQHLKQNCSNRLQVLHLDVTKDESVEKAVNFVKQNLGSSVLWAVVNNAGILKGFNLEFTTMQDIEDTMEVNAFGQVRVTKAFLPLLKEFKGRIINITSNAGRIPIADLGAYTMSKFAAVAFTDCISQEMSEWGIRAISIEPEIFRSPIGNEKNITELMNKTVSKVKKDVFDDYGEEYFKKLQNYLLTLLEMSPCNTNIVINNIELAITLKYPNHVYKPRGNILTRLFYDGMQYLPFDLVEQVSLLGKKVIGFPMPKKIKCQIK